MENEYIQEVVWVGITMGGATIKDFEDFFATEWNFRVKYVEEFKMESGRYNGLNCIIFKIHTKDIPRFSIFRVSTTDMKWIEDFCHNEMENIPIGIHEKYNTEWKKECVMSEP